MNRWSTDRHEIRTILELADPSFASKRHDSNYSVIISEQFSQRNCDESCLVVKFVKHLNFKLIWKG